MDINGPLFLFTSPQGTPAWYKDSLSNALRTVAQKSKSVLSQDVYAIATAGRAYIHESYINDMYATNPARPVHPDPLFVYSGYKASLVNVSRIAGQPGFEENSDGRICCDINTHLQDILTLVQSKGNDVGRLFKDPEMNRLLVNFTNVL
ncbi:hypothetical protein B0J17DRAFT_722813 [Rhizoctonia solani]|nr:hypothetical protein B0J17DRAFT_722813 [Rhizoctonia solani]